MALYEHVFLARHDIAPQQIDQLVEQYKNVIEINGGKVGRIENWGLRSLAYRIRKNRKAYYALMNIDAPVNAVVEMERQMRINEDVLRFLTVRVESHAEESSAILSRRDREERFGKDDDRPRHLRRPRDNDSGEGGE
ncbi:MAG: small subunit ribosomal protein S6 [Candidatus Tokpelaia sp. JSC189]|nr:MAG: small subunit ribosomal protein S6 [Candidatus Tokpelaia sp. JSC189]